MSTLELQIAERSKKYKDTGLTDPHQFIAEDMLYTSYQGLNRNSANGVDGETWYSYQQHHTERMPELLSEFKSGKCRAPMIRRVYIPKGKAQRRPLGVPTIEDEILQESVRRVLTPTHELEFIRDPYGFRQGRSAHQALERLFEEVSFKGMHHTIDADILAYFGSMAHQGLRSFLDQRVRDGVIRKMMDKRPKRGVLEGGQVSYPSSGTPQGGVISPLLSNIYLHDVLDKWSVDQIQPL